METGEVSNPPVAGPDPVARDSGPQNAIHWVTHAVERGLSWIYAVDLSACRPTAPPIPKSADDAFQRIDDILQQAKILGRKGTWIHLDAARFGDCVIVASDRDAQNEWLLPSVQKRLHDDFSTWAGEAASAETPLLDLARGDRLEIQGHELHATVGPNGRLTVQCRSMEKDAGQLAVSSLRRRFSLAASGLEWMVGAVHWAVWALTRTKTGWACSVGLLASVLVSVYFAFPRSRDAPPDSSVLKFQRATFRNSRGDTVPYALYKPPAFVGDGPFPLIVFLHGYAERGGRGGQLLAAGLAPALPGLIKQNGTFDFVTLFPFDLEGNWWRGSAGVDNLYQLLDSVIIRDYHIDPDRVYLVGQSSGAHGVWVLAMHSPQRWAAIVPIGGWFDGGDVNVMRDIPCWVFHGAADTESRVGHTRAVVEALKAAGGKVRFTEIPNAPHIIWPKVCSDLRLYQWLAEQKRKSS